jgi:hypothetical protein
MACRALGRWSVLVGVAGTTTWPAPAAATSSLRAWSMWTGGVGVAMWSPHPAATPPATPTGGPPAGTWTAHPPWFPRCCSSGCSLDRSSEEPVRSSSQLSLTARVTAMRGRRWPRSWPGSPPRRWGQRNRQLWESTRNLYNLVATGALDHRQVDQGLLDAAERCGLLTEEPRQTHRTLASGRQVGLAHPGRPRQPTPERTHASPTPPARAAGERTKERG